MSKLLENSILYTLVSVLQKAINLFLLPVYTRLLTPYDYGVIGVINSIIRLLSHIYSLAIPAAIRRFYSKYMDDKERVRGLWGTGLSIVILFSLFMTIILGVFNRSLLHPFLKGMPFYPFMVLGLIIVMFDPIYNLYQSSLQAKQIGGRYSFNNLLFFVTKLFLIVLLVILFRLSSTGVLLAAAITSLIFAIYSFIAFLPDINIKIRGEHIKELLKYSLPLVPHSLSGWTISMIDRMFLNGLRSTEEVGVYSVGFQFGNIMNIMTTAVNQAYIPWFFEQYQLGEAGRKEIVSTSKALIYIYSYIGIVLSLFTQDVLRIMVPETFYEGWKVVPFLTFSYVFNGMYFTYCNTLFLEKTVIIPFVTFSSAITNIILNISLIPKYGIIGAAIASLVANIVSSIITLIVAERIASIRFSWIEMYSVAFISLFISLGIFYSASISYWIVLLIKIIIVLLASIFIYVKYYKTIILFVNVARNKLFK